MILLIASKIVFVTASIAFVTLMTRSIYYMVAAK